MSSLLEQLSHNLVNQQPESVLVDENEYQEIFEHDVMNSPDKQKKAVSWDVPLKSQLVRKKMGRPAGPLRRYVPSQ